MKITTKFPGDRPLMDIGYKWKPIKVLGFISTDMAGTTYPDSPYLYNLPVNYYNVYIWPVFSPFILGSYFNACNAIENKNNMLKYDLALEKYWVK